MKSKSVYGNPLPCEHGESDDRGARVDHVRKNDDCDGDRVRHVNGYALSLYLPLIFELQFKSK